MRAAVLTADVIAMIYFDEGEASLFEVPDFKNFKI